MWAKRSEMLAPLSDLVGECGETKTTRKNKVKKKPWHWDSIHQIAFDWPKKIIGLTPRRVSAAVAEPKDLVMHLNYV